MSIALDRHSPGRIASYNIHSLPLFFCYSILEPHLYKKRSRQFSAATVNLCFGKKEEIVNLVSATREQNIFIGMHRDLPQTKRYSNNGTD